MLTIPMLLAIIDDSKDPMLEFLINRPAKPDGFSPNTLKKEQMMKSGWISESPRVSRSFGAKQHASSTTCHPCSLARVIHRMNPEAWPREAGGHNLGPFPLGAFLHCNHSLTLIIIDA